MAFCRRNLELYAVMTLGELEAHRAGRLVTHLERCEEGLGGRLVGAGRGGSEEDERGGEGSEFQPALNRD